MGVETQAGGGADSLATLVVRRSVERRGPEHLEPSVGSPDVLAKAVLSPGPDSDSAGHAPDAAARERFVDFYRQQFPALAVLAAAVARDATFAEDIVQETMHLVHDRWDELSSAGSQRAWARRTVINRSIDRKRRIGREQAASAKLWDPPAVDFAPSENRHLWEAVRSLPDKQRAAIALYYIGSYSTAEVAEVLGCSGQAARTTLHRARAALRHKLGSRPHYEGGRS